MKTPRAAAVLGCVLAGVCSSMTSVAGGLLLHVGVVTASAAVLFAGRALFWWAQCCVSVTQSFLTYQLVPKSHIALILGVSCIIDRVGPTVAKFTTAQLAESLYPHFSDPYLFNPNTPYEHPR